MLKTTRSVVAFIFSLLFALSAVTPAFASGPESVCTGGGGVWTGADPVTGTCTYPPGTASFNLNCASGDTSYVEVYDTSALVDSYCVTPIEDTPIEDTPIEDTPNPSPSTDDNEETTTLVLPGGKNGSATFPPGSCPQKCTISANLPGPAENSLPADAIATIYVRVIDEGGTPGTGSYKVCFENPDGEPLVIYRYISGAWVAVALANTNPICTTASGDGAFYLG